MSAPIFSDDLLATARAFLDDCRVGKHTLALAESCTGGLIAALLTEIPGSSDVLTHGFIPYANAAKEQMLGVDGSLIQAHGAVSEEVARAMAQGALRVSGASLSVAVTGIAGPGGGSRDKPVGLVHIASARTGGETLHGRCIFSGTRAEIRLQAVRATLALVVRLAC